jgi:hypothetical protein
VRLSEGEKGQKLARHGLPWKGYVFLFWGERILQPLEFKYYRLKDGLS